MGTNKSQFWNKAMFWGFIIALTSMVSTTVFYSTDNFFAQTRGWVDIAIYAIGILGCTILYRNSLDENTDFPYGRALGLGVATSFFASLIIAVFTFVLYKFIDPGLIEESIVMAEEKLLESGLSDDMIEQQMDMQTKFITPAIMSIGIIFNVVIMGLIISLITSIFTRKKAADGFNAAMSEIDDE